MIIITGGNGWLGQRVAQAFAGTLDNDLGNHAAKKIRVLVNEKENHDFLKKLGCELVVGDIRDDDACKKLCRGAEGSILIHLAGVIHPRKVSEFIDVNFSGTAHLLAAAKISGVRRMVAMSSNSPIGCNPSNNHTFTEESPYHPYMGYGHSKWQMELMLRDHIASRQAPEMVIVRAPWFYGPGQPSRQTFFLSMVKSGKFPIVGNGMNRRSMGYVDNLAKGIYLCAQHTDAAGEIFWLADEQPYSMNEIIDTIQRVFREDLNIPSRHGAVRLPGLLGNAATWVDGGLQWLGLYHQKIHVLSELNKNIACDISKAKRILGYQPAIQLREGMRRAIEWCLQNGHTL